MTDDITDEKRELLEDMGYIVRAEPAEDMKRVGVADWDSARIRVNGTILPDCDGLEFRLSDYAASYCNVEIIVDGEIIAQLVGL